MIVRMVVASALVALLIVALAGKLADRTVPWVSAAALAMVVEALAVGLLAARCVRLACWLCVGIAVGGLLWAWSDRHAGCSCFGVVATLDWRWHASAAGLLGLLASSLLWMSTPRPGVK